MTTDERAGALLAVACARELARAIDGGEISPRASALAALNLYKLAAAVTIAAGNGRPTARGWREAAAALERGISHAGN